MANDKLSTNNEDVEIDQETIQTIRERVLELEKEQLHLQKPNKIIGPIKDAISEEVE